MLGDFSTAFQYITSHCKRLTNIQGTLYSDKWCTNIRIHLIIFSQSNWRMMKAHMQTAFQNLLFFLGRLLFIVWWVGWFILGLLFVFAFVVVFFYFFRGDWQLSYLSHPKHNKHNQCYYNMWLRLCVWTCLRRRSCVQKVSSQDAINDWQWQNLWTTPYFSYCVHQNKSRCSWKKIHKICLVWLP